MYLTLELKLPSLSHNGNLKPLSKKAFENTVRKGDYACAAFSSFLTMFSNLSKRNCTICAIMKLLCAKLFSVENKLSG